MNLTGRTFFAALFLLAAPTATAQIQLTIAVEPAATLPGIVPSLRVEVRNTGTAPAEVPDLVGLFIALPGQEPFLAGSPGTGNHWTLELPVNKTTTTIIPPGEARDFTFWTAGNGLPIWFLDDRISSLGTYRIRLVAGIDPSEATYRHVIRTTPRPAAVTSNEVTYTVLEPIGEDALVWTRIRELLIRIPGGEISQPRSGRRTQILDTLAIASPGLSLSMWTRQLRCMREF